MSVSSAEADGINYPELRRYVERISDRWPLEVARLGGARVADERGALPQRERGPEFIVVFVSEAYESMPWLERVYVAGSLWDALEMGDKVDVHCYTPPEYGRRLITLRAVQDAAEGIDLLGERG